MTINEIIENENIRSDRYAMAAISYIFKAFGDNNRSKEYWPWGRDVQCEWTSSKGTNNDITYAQLLLERARIKFDEEQTINNDYSKINDDIMTNTFDKQMKELRRRINKLAINMKRINSSSQEVISVSNRANDVVDSVIPKKDE